MGVKQKEERLCNAAREYAADPNTKPLLLSAALNYAREKFARLKQRDQWKYRRGKKRANVERGE